MSCLDSWASFFVWDLQRSNLPDRLGGSLISRLFEYDFYNLTTNNFKALLVSVSSFLMRPWNCNSGSIGMMIDEQWRYDERVRSINLSRTKRNTAKEDPCVIRSFALQRIHSGCSIGIDGSLCVTPLAVDSLLALLLLLFWPFRNDVISIDECCPLCSETCVFVRFFSDLERVGNVRVCRVSEKKTKEKAAPERVREKKARYRSARKYLEQDV